MESNLPLNSCRKLCPTTINAYVRIQVSYKIENLSTHSLKSFWILAISISATSNNNFECRNLKKLSFKKKVNKTPLFLKIKIFYCFIKILSYFAFKFSWITKFYIIHWVKILYFYKIFIPYFQIISPIFDFLSLLF